MSYDGKEMVDDKDNQTRSWKAVWQRKKKTNQKPKNLDNLVSLSL